MSSCQAQVLCTTTATSNTTTTTMYFYCNDEHYRSPVSRDIGVKHAQRSVDDNLLTCILVVRYSNPVSFPLFLFCYFSLGFLLSAAAEQIGESLSSEQ